MTSRAVVRRLALTVSAVITVTALTACSTVSGTASSAPAVTSSPVAPVPLSSTAGTTAAPASDTSPSDTIPSHTTPTDATPTDASTTPAPPTAVPSTGAPTGGPSTSVPITDVDTGSQEPGTTGQPTRTGGTGRPPATTGATGTAGPLRDWEHFRSPSGNITCLIAQDDGTATVRCDLLESEIREQHDCGGTGDWGHAVVLERGKAAAMRCISDTVADPSVPALPYGASTQVGPISCTSSVEGMYCSDDTGHGFRLAKASYEVR